VSRSANQSSTVVVDRTAGLKHEQRCRWRVGSEKRLLDLQGIDNAEIIETVHARAPMIRVSAWLRR
jgi:hypothetical protein